MRPSSKGTTRRRAEINQPFHLARNAMSVQYSTTHRSDNMSDIVTQLGATAYLLLYSGSAPANCAASATGTLLASLACSSTAGTVASGVLTMNSISSAAAAATGVA